MVLNLIVFIALLVILVVLSRRGWSLANRAMTALVIGAAYGLVLQSGIGNTVDSVNATLSWTNLLGSSYISLLKMIIMPLVLVMMVAAVVKIEDTATLGKIGGLVIGLLLTTTMLAAVIGALLSAGFNLTADGLVQGERELARASVLVTRQTVVADLALPQILVSFLPTNIFSDLAGSRPTSIIAVVIFGILLGIAGLLVKQEKPEMGLQFQRAMDLAQVIVLKLVNMIIGLTPYGVLALMTKMGAQSSASDILSLIQFVLVSYLAIMLMFLVHAAILMFFRVNPLLYFKRAWPALIFAFSSRSSAATIPINVSIQVNDLDNHPAVANMSASLGATIGQNGCAGIYPAMLAAMIAPTLGIDPLSVEFFFPLVMMVAISSFGIAGVGGGATFAALVVLPAMGLPIALVALLISIEPLIDMARTALNVSGAMVAGTVTQRLLRIES